MNRSAILDAANKCVTGLSVDLNVIFRAGFVRRWHTNPDLCHTVDRIDGHSARVARIIMALHPRPTLAIIFAALIHDDGESVVGDIKAPTKDADATLANLLALAEIDAVADIWPLMPGSNGDDAAWLKLADRLDAYMWAQHHAPHVLGGDGWPEARAWILMQSSKLGCRASVESAITPMKDSQ